METKNLMNAGIRKSILVCILMMTAVMPAFSQTSTVLLIPTFDLELVLTVLGVVALALFMFVAMIRYKNKESKGDKTRAQRTQHQGSNPHRRHSNMGHFKY